MSVGYRYLAAFILLIFSPLSFSGYGAKLCKEPNYQCYTVKRGDTWEKLFPMTEQRDLVKRINRMNIKIYRGMVIAVPESLDGTVLDHSPFAQEIDPPGKKTIIVSLSKHAFGAYNADGTLEHWGPISAARGYCPDVRRSCHTKQGSFAVYQKKGESCKSTRYPIGRGGAPMPYCMFFHGNYALHGSYEVPGHHASHGCVRLFVDDARWLNQEFTTERTAVIVKK